MSIPRRKFLGMTAAVTLAAPAIHARPKPGKRYKTVLIGSGWWGNVISEMAMRHGSVDVRGVCDVDEKMIDDGVKLVQSKAGHTPKRYKDFRECIEKEKPRSPSWLHPIIGIR